MTGRITPGDGVPGYGLRLEGHLDNRWYDWDSGLTMHHENDGTTTLRSPGLDRAPCTESSAACATSASPSSRSRPDEAHAGREQPDEPGDEP